MPDVAREHLLTGAVGDRVDRIKTYRVRLGPAQATGLHTHPAGVRGYVESGRIAFRSTGTLCLSWGRAVCSMSRPTP